MESEMVERVARAICDEAFEKLGAPKCYDLNKALYDDVAKAAIQAMREPTRLMVHAGLDDQAYVDSTLHSTWRSMIDEATGERHRAVANTDTPGKSGMGEG